MTDISVPPETTAPVATLRHSSLLRRLAGMVYDVVAVIAIMMVTVMACLLITFGQLDHHAWWFRGVLLLAVIAYFIASWLRGGQTLGMRPWRMVLRKHDGGKVTPTRACIRAAVVLAPLLVLSLAHLITAKTALLILLAVWATYYAVALFNPHRRALHDIVAGTELVHTVVPRKRRT